MTVKRKRPRPGGRAHRPVLERLQDLSPQLHVALVLLDEAALLGGEAVGLHLGLLGRPLRGPVTSWDRAGGGVRMESRGGPHPWARGWLQRHPPADLLFRLPFLGDVKPSSPSSSSLSRAARLLFSFSFLARASR